jgi:hypothetical protein
MESNRTFNTTIKPSANFIIVRIKENSLFAKVAAHYMKADSVAMVIGKTIHLHNTSRERFLNKPRWVRHEIAHVYQWLELGYFRFAFKYILESFRNGYFNNKFEVEARLREDDLDIMKDVTIV